MLVSTAHTGYCCWLSMKSVKVAFGRSSHAGYSLLGCKYFDIVVGVRKERTLVKMSKRKSYCTEYGRRRMLLGEYENRGGLGCAQFCAESHSNEGETGGRRAQSASASCACPRKCSMHPAWATTRVELGSLYFPMCVLCTPYCVTVHHELVGEVHLRLSILYSVLCTA